MNEQSRALADVLHASFGGTPLDDRVAERACDTLREMFARGGPWPDYVAVIEDSGYDRRAETIAEVLQSAGETCNAILELCDGQPQLQQAIAEQFGELYKLHGKSDTLNVADCLGRLRKCELPTADDAVSYCPHCDYCYRTLGECEHRDCFARVRCGQDGPPEPYPVEAAKELAERREREKRDQARAEALRQAAKERFDRERAAAERWRKEQIAQAQQRGACIHERCLFGRHGDKVKFVRHRSGHPHLANGTGRG